MPPALLLVRVSRTRWLILPLPLFLLWPLLLLAWLGLGLVWLVTSGRPRPGGLLAGMATLRVLGALRGTKIDVWGKDASIYMQFI
jgi:hypothetical protein